MKYYSLPRYIHHGDLSEEVSDDHFSIPCHDFFFFRSFNGVVELHQVKRGRTHFLSVFILGVGIEIASFMIAKLGRARTL